MSREIIEKARRSQRVGKYLPKYSKTVSILKEYVESFGYTVISAYHENGNIWVETDCGMRVYGNGYTHKIEL